MTTTHAVLPEGIPHSAADLIAHRGQVVRVVVGGHGYGGVPQELLYEFGVYAAAEQDGSAGMPEIVKSYLWQTGLLEERFEGPLLKVFGIDGCSTLVEKIRLRSS